jgi:hypothetical protein
MKSTMDTRRTSFATCNERVIQWLLAGDPAIRWQVFQDLLAASKYTVERERQKIAHTGWGARLLAKQHASGAWARGQTSDAGLYSPKWTSTTYTMLLLRDFGLPSDSPSAQNACKLLLDHGLQRDGGISYGTWAKWTHRGETCITGMVLSLLSYLNFEDPRLDTISSHLLQQQMPDGGWNCRRPGGATHSSVHTTISALEGLRHFELLPSTREPRRLHEVRTAQLRAREFLLAHHLFRSHRTGKVIKPEFLRFSFPPRWHYDILRALDYFQSVNAPRDPRLTEAIDIIRSHQSNDGRWPLQHTYRGKIYFELERLGAPSRWNTLRALRVLSWWNRGGTKHEKPKPH